MLILNEGWHLQFEDGGYFAYCPGFVPSAGQWMVDRQVKVVGHVTQANDHPPATATGPQKSLLRACRKGMAPMRIAVIGEGLMGHGIALTLARAGHAVAVTDPVPAARAAVRDLIADSLRLIGADADQAAQTLDRIRVVDGVPDAVGDAEAVFEGARS